MAQQESPPSGHHFCGNCGAALTGEAVCSNCGAPASPAEVQAPPAAATAPDDYIPYCRTCGTHVDWEDSKSCPRCGVAPLCPQHYAQGAQGCALCSPERAAAGGGVQNSLPPFTNAGPSGPWAQGRPAVPCGNCGARIREGVRFCPQCGAQQLAGVSRAAAGETEYMGFWVRVGAAVIDAIITGVAAAILVRFVPIPFIGSLLSVIYYVTFTATRGQTIGKMALRIQVVDGEGNIPSLQRVLLREVLGKLISGVALLLGYLWVAWDPRKRAWHDYIGGTYVVRKPDQRP